jgi:hypothetical protein
MNVFNSHVRMVVHALIQMVRSHVIVQQDGLVLPVLWMLMNVMFYSVPMEAPVLIHQDHIHVFVI